MIDAIDPTFLAEDFAAAGGPVPPPTMSLWFSRVPSALPRLAAGRRSFPKPFEKLADEGRPKAGAGGPPPAAKKPGPGFRWRQLGRTEQIRARDERSVTGAKKTINSEVMNFPISGTRFRYR